MSTSTPASTTTSTTTAQYPQTLKEQTFALYCNGLRSPAIAKQLGVPERTIRAWVRATMETVIAGRSDNLLAYACLAEERQLQIAAASWEAYNRHATFEELQLDYLQHGTHEEFAAHPPRITAAGARYLALAQRAAHEVAKLQGAYNCPPPKPAPVELRILSARPGPEHYEPPAGPYVTPITGLALEQYQHQMWVDSLQAQIEADQERVAKGRTRLAELNALLASQSTPTDDDDLDDLDDEDEEDDTDEIAAAIPAETATSLPADPVIPAETATAPTLAADAGFAAETATSITPLAAGGAGAIEGAPTGRPDFLEYAETEFAAKTATPTTGLAAGFQPANLPPPIPSHIVASSPPAAPSLPGKGVGG